MPPNAVEAGIKDLRVHFVRETVTGVTQADPAWLRYSDTVQDVSESPNANLYMQRGAGEFDIQDFLVGPEDHTKEISYELQNWITSGNDAAADGLLRAADGAFLNTHSYQSRQELLSGGTLSSGRRIYTVGKGGRIGRVTLSGDPNTGEPLKVMLSYTYEKLRSYVIDQPASTGVVTVVSDNAGDTSQTVTVENEGAGTSEGIALNGTTPVAGATSFADVDSLSLSAETEGDITISHTSQTICIILGKVSQGGYEGDLGIPPLGSGSFETALGGAYEQIVGSSIQRGGADLEINATISAFEMQVENTTTTKATTTIFGCRTTNPPTQPMKTPKRSKCSSSPLRVRPAKARLFRIGRSANRAGKASKEKAPAAATPMAAKIPNARIGGMNEARARARNPAASVTEVNRMARQISTMARTMGWRFWA